MTETFVLFEVDHATYAARSEQVVRVEMVDSITHVPNTPDFIQGVTAVRGHVIPVIGLRQRFHLPPAAPDYRTRLVVIRIENRQVGLLADSAREFIRIDPDQIHPVPEGLSGPGVQYLDGVVNLNNRLILVVNLPRLIDPDERAAISAAGFEPTQGE